MANQPPSYPTNSSLHTPPFLSSQSCAPFTPRSSSIADDSDVEFDPTPLQSPRGGPDYDDLPPSYDEAQHQAVSDARNGVTPLDPSQIEAHRLTLNEEPDEPEIWEYRIRGEELDAAGEHERAPEYENFTNDLGTSVPVQHVQNSESIPVGRTGNGNPPYNAVPILITNLVDRALDFTQQQPDADVQFAPRLTKRIAIPRQGSPTEHQEGGNSQAIQFLRAYTKALRAHSIQPAEFVAFLEGLNALCIASATTLDTQLTETETKNMSSEVVRDYIRGANEGFFAPRGLRVSVQSLSVLINALKIPTKRGQRNAAIASILDQNTTVEKRAQALHPWTDGLETDVPASSPQSIMLREMAERLKQQTSKGRTSSSTNTAALSNEHGHEDPPHSIPEASTEHGHPAHGRPHGGRRRGGRRGGHHGGPWTPFGTPGHGPFGAPSNGPFGRPGRGPFGGRGRGRGHGPPPFGGHQAADRAGDHAQSANEWAALGQNLGKWGEEFGKRMGDWGQQFGKQAEVWGQDFTKRNNAWSSNTCAVDSGSGSGSGQAGVSVPQDDTLPPSYNTGPIGQESGILRGDSIDAVGPPSYEHVSKGKQLVEVKDDETSSLSSDSSVSSLGSDSDSDDEEDDLPDTQAIFLKRIQSINEQAEDSARKGKKSPEEIAQERALAIEKVQNEKTVIDLKIEKAKSKRAMRREYKQKRRDLMREHKHKKRELRSELTGKGKGKAKKTPEWKQARREYRDKKKELKEEQLKTRKEWKNARYERARSRLEGADEIEDQLETGRMVWVVVENLED